MNRSITVILISLIFFINFAHSGETYIPNENEELNGTWVNPDYNTSTIAAKIVNNPDGSRVTYGTTDSNVIRSRGEATIKDKWADAEGNVWYKVVSEYKLGGLSSTYYSLIKVSNSGKTLEYVSSRAGYPKELSEKHPDYHIYHRQQ